jgi:hypothetical protein
MYISVAYAHASCVDVKKNVDMYIHILVSSWCSTYLVKCRDNFTLPYIKTNCVLKNITSRSLYWNYQENEIKTWYEIQVKLSNQFVPKSMQLSI